MTGQQESTTDTEAQNPAGMTWQDDLRHGGCGFLMGVADIVPGVSGGTMALIVGIYERLVAAISHVDSTFVSHILNRRIRAAVKYADLRFLVALGTGVLVGAGGLASVMKLLLSDHRTLTYAGFTGMILASSLIVSRRVAQWNAKRFCLMLVAAAAAWWLVNLTSLQNPPDSRLYLFFCGAIGVCATILPGISGAFILLLLSRYEPVVDAIRSFVHLDWSAELIVTLVVFSLGCLTGLLSFARILKRMLENHQDSTIAVMCGFMLGSLYRLWPFQRDLTPDVAEFKHKHLQPFLPESLTGEVWSVVFVAVLAATVVLSLDLFADRVGTSRK